MCVHADRSLHPPFLKSKNSNLSFSNQKNTLASLTLHDNHPPTMTLKFKKQRTPLMKKIQGLQAPMKLHHISSWLQLGFSLSKKPFLSNMNSDPISWFKNNSYTTLIFLLCILFILLLKVSSNFCMQLLDRIFHFLTIKITILIRRKM